MEDDEDLGEEEAFKVVLIGESGVGKTSIISQFIHKIFQDDIQPSMGGTFTSKSLLFCHFCAKISKDWRCKANDFI